MKVKTKRAEQRTLILNTYFRLSDYGVLLTKCFFKEKVFVTLTDLSNEPFQLDNFPDIQSTK